MTLQKQDENGYPHIQDETGYFDEEYLEELRNFMINHLLSFEEDLQWLSVIKICRDKWNRINYKASWQAQFIIDNSENSNNLHEIKSVRAEIIINFSYYNHQIDLDKLEISKIDKAKRIIIEDFKKTLSHEYGHHWTLSYLAVNYGIDYTRQRMPWKYYWLRKLNPLDHAHDYSKGWENCDQEIVAEDYRVLFAPHPHNQEHEIIRRRNGSFKNPGEPIKQYIQELAEFPLGIWDRLAKILNL